MGSYNPKEVSLILNNIHVTGFQEGTMVEASKDEDYFSPKVSALGEVEVAESNNPLGTVSFTLSQNSLMLTTVRALAKSREEIPVWVIRAGGVVKEKLGGTRARFKKSPGASFSNDLEDRKFEMTVFDYSEE